MAGALTANIDDLAWLPARRFKPFDGRHRLPFAHLLPAPAGSSPFHFASIFTNTMMICVRDYARLVRHRVQYESNGNVPCCLPDNGYGEPAP